MRGPHLVAGAAALALLAACTGGSPPPAGPTGPAPDAPTSSAAAEPPLSWGPTQDEVDEARAVVAAMPVEQAAGQVIVASYRGTDPATPAELVERLDLAGVILMGDNVAGVDQVRATAAAVQAAHAATGRDWPAVVTVDQEGGRVARLGEPVTELPTLMTAGAAAAGGDLDVVTDATAAAGAELRSLGVTWVMAPVADVTTGPDDPTIGSRSASDDPHLVAQVVGAAVTGYRQAGVVPVVKHWPGHGSVTADSHETLPVQDAPLAALQARDLVPFDAAVDAGAPALMMSHLAVEAVEPGVPSSLSAPGYALLRRETGFTGPVVTDALDMAAVTRDRGPGDAAVAALAAGADLLLMPADPAAAHAAVVAAVASGTVPRSRLDEAAARVVALSRHAGATTGAATTGAGDTGAGTSVPGTSAPGTAAPQSRALSAAGVTVADGPCSGPLVGEAVQVTGGTGTDRARFTEAARAAGLRVGSGDVVRLLGTSTSSGSGDVVVALDAPYGLSTSDADARVALLGRTPGAFAALVDVLTGARTAPGRLPVAVDGLPERAGCG
ncbi:glycoside hydrolase family 3 N-terminal domain-containing protein [Thalassiella azotivora]